MTIGKYCQICGEAKKASEVITEAHGIVVTAPCLMEKVYGDPPAEPSDARAMAKYCAVCGAEQPEEFPSHCVSCKNPLTAETAAEDLANAWAPAEFNDRITAFFIDSVIVVGLAAGTVFAIGLLQSLVAAPSEVSGEAMDLDKFFTSVKVLAAALVFIAYHSLFAALVHRTPGKMIMGIAVALKNGKQKISLSRAMLRSALYLFTLYVIPIGLLPLIFQEPPSKWLGLIEKDAMFHNTLTDTVVIKPK